MFGKRAADAEAPPTRAPQARPAAPSAAPPPPDKAAGPIATRPQRSEPPPAPDPARARAEASKSGKADGPKATSGFEQLRAA
ncbi:MAG: hypothetical protein B7Z13_03220, partial [Caulobacterales bacterium 32-67-6]